MPRRGDVSSPSHRSDPSVESSSSSSAPSRLSLSTPVRPPNETYGSCRRDPRQGGSHGGTESPWGSLHQLWRLNLRKGLTGLGQIRREGTGRSCMRVRSVLLRRHTSRSEGTGTGTGTVVEARPDRYGQPVVTVLDGTDPQGPPHLHLRRCGHVTPGTPSRLPLRQVDDGQHFSSPLEVRPLTRPKPRRLHVPRPYPPPGVPPEALSTTHPPTRPAPRSPARSPTDYTSTCHRGTGTSVRLETPSPIPWLCRLYFLPSQKV